MGSTTSFLPAQNPGAMPFPPWLVEVFEDLPTDQLLVLLRDTSSKYHAVTFGSDKSNVVWYWLCAKFAREYNLYCPRNLIDNVSDVNWEDFFHELIQCKDMWQPPSNDRVTDDSEPQTTNELDIPKTKTYEVQVAVRFRPLTARSRDYYVRDEQEERITIPLHQRISLIKQTKKLDKSEDAFKMLAKEGSWFGDMKNVGVDELFDPKNQTAVDKENESLPVNETNKCQHGKFTPKVQAILPHTGDVVIVAPSVGMREFSYDHVFAPEVSQEEVYRTITGNRKLVADLLNGVNNTILVYGQTGSGKTHTMFGPDLKSAMGTNTTEQGVIPRICSDALVAIADRNALVDGEKNKFDCALSMSYIEVFGDQVNDLLKDGAPIGQSKVAVQRLVSEGAAAVPLTTTEELVKLLETGEKAKRTAATLMNERSTRAHSLIVLRLAQTHRGSGLKLHSNLILADLGGSEQLKKSLGSRAKEQASEDDKAQEDERTKEAVNINLGLLALKQVVEALKFGRSHVPYHDSKLTLLLSSGLGGNARTRIVICGSQEPRNTAETYNSLRFGEDCGFVKSTANKSVAVVSHLLEQVEKRIEELRAEISKKEKWVNKVTYRRDENVEQGTFEAALNSENGEKIVTSVLEGAEEEKQELEELIIKRAELVGDDVEASLVEAGFKGFGRFKDQEEIEKVPERFAGGIEFENGLIDQVA